MATSPTANPAGAQGRARADRKPERRSVLAVLFAVIAAPRELFARPPEVVPHGQTLRTLALLRLPPWLLLAAMTVARLLSDTPEPQPLLPIHGILEAPLARALSVWLLLMVPVGLTALYFGAGLLAHLGLVLTGGASRSIGATMRAVGLSLAPGLLVLGLAEVPLHLGLLDGPPFIGLVAALMLATWLWSARALGLTHKIGRIRGLLVAVVPVALFGATSLGRATLVMRDVPFLEPPSSSPYYIP